MGRHLTFCMAPDDILIRNSFHMLTEAEKDARRAEYKALSDGSSRSKQNSSKLRTAVMPAAPMVPAEVSPAVLQSQASACLCALPALPALLMAGRRNLRRVQMGLLACLPRFFLFASVEVSGGRAGG